MSSHRSFIRKIIYLVLIAALLMPLFWLSQPATDAVKGGQGSPGGKLAQLRKKYKLSQAQLGEVDPTSVTIKLATLGMRGVAANILWEKANDFKMKKDWTNFGATLNQITKVQPNFINVWINQAWNLSFNCSVAFDDYRERYRWVVKGFDFLKEGMKYNEREPTLRWNMGWMVSDKIGKADESKEYRKLFREDDDFHGSRPLALRDNWLVGKEWFDRAVEMVNEYGGRIMGQGPLIYHASGPLCQMYYAQGLEKDGTFGEVAKTAWIGAAAEWHRYGSEDIASSWIDEKTQKPIMLRLNDEEMHLQAADKLVAQLDAIQPGLRKKILAEKRAALTAGQREALDTPVEKRTGKQFQLAAQAQAAIETTHNEVARRVTGPRRKEAIQLAKDAADHEQLATYIHHYRETINFVYWRLRAEVEQTDELLAARKFIHQGDQAYGEGDLIAARNAYTKGLEGWRNVLNKNPLLVPNAAAGDELTDVVKRYRRILNQLDQPFPKNFILQDILDATKKPAETPATKPGKK